jgi:hypothetical protein
MVFLSGVGVEPLRLLGPMLISAAVFTILKALVCRHRWARMYERHGREFSAVIKTYVEGFKALHHCEKCGRLKYIKIDDPEYVGNDPASEVSSS